MRAKKKFYVVVYDIHENKIRTQVSALLERFGVRINFSVFECIFTAKQLCTVQEKIAKSIDKNSDTVVYYPICVECYTKIEYQPSERPRTIETITVV